MPEEKPEKKPEKAEKPEKKPEKPEKAEKKPEKAEKAEKKPEKAEKAEKKPERKRPRARKREKRLVVRGRAYIYSTFNNTIITLTDGEGRVLASASSGTAGFKGSRKGTPYAAQMAADLAARKGSELGLRQVEVWIRGPGSGREAAIRSLQAAGIQVSAIRDVTPIPHDGCRPPKRRRV